MPNEYLVASEEGAAHTNSEVGATVELELSESDERALICAGWLEHTKKEVK